MLLYFYGPTETNIESSVSINCTVLEGHPPPNVSIVTPQGKLIDDIIISFIATLQDSGNYTCIANNLWWLLLLEPIY